MEAEDVHCRLLYKNESVTMTRECGQMLTEERAVRHRLFLAMGSPGTKLYFVFFRAVLLSRIFMKFYPCVPRVKKIAMLTFIYEYGYTFPLSRVLSAFVCAH